MKKINTPIITIDNNFYLAIPINAMWHNHFANLSSKDEQKCEELFIKKVVRNKEVWDLIKVMHSRT